MVPPRVLILSAAIGEGHDGPARELAAGIAEVAPETEVVVRDGLAAMGWPVSAAIENGSSFHSPLGLVLSDFQHWLGLRWRPTSVLASWLLAVLGGRRLRRLIAAEHPAVIVSTYPGVTEVLGRLRSLRRLPVPVVAAVTDLAALRFWVHPSADLHLVIHPESAAEGAVDRGGGRGGGGGHGVLLAGAPLTSLPRGGAGGAGSGYGGTSGGRVGGRVGGR